MAVIPVMKPLLGAEEAATVAETLASGWLAQGPAVAAFERAFAARVGASEAVAVSSCTAGLHLALHANGIGPGDEVVVPSLSFVATANAPTYVGAAPVFADVELETLSLSADTIEPALTARTRAVIVAHQAGGPADIPAIRELCAPRGILVIEDAACAAGATLGNRPIGSHSDQVVFSFHPRKIITTGEGGMIATGQPELAARLRRLRSHAMSISDAARHESGTPVFESYEERGFNYRMTDIQAAIGLVQLGRLDGIVARRRELAARYQDALAHLPGLRTARDPQYGTTNYQSFWLELPDSFPMTRDDLLGRLFAAGIGARRGIMAAHLEPAHRNRPLRTALPVTERHARRGVILPLFHEMTDDEQQRVIAVIEDAAQPFAWTWPTPADTDLRAHAAALHR